MNIKRCSQCGWEYPATWPGKKCKFCGGSLIGKACRICGEWLPNHGVGKPALCKDCKRAINAEWQLTREIDAKIKYDAWLERIKCIPTPYRTLTEKEWIDACIHFDGCAYCGNEQIDTREMFIPFKLGGRYCAWNIIPLCERCTKARRNIENPFLRMDSKIYRHKNNEATKYSYNLERLQKITEYLQSKMEECNE